MRIAPVVLVIFSALSIPACAASLDDKVPNDQIIQYLEERAAQAPAKDQCFLYAQLVHEMVEFSAQQYAAGDVQKANGLLQRAQMFTHRIHLALAANNKKLKDAQILMRHTAFRLTELLHSSTYEERPLVQETLAELNQAQNDAMLQVFKK